MSEQMRHIVIAPGQGIVIRAAGQPGGDPLAELLYEIQALGHHRVTLHQIDDQWYCSSYYPTSDRKPDETDGDWIDRLEARTNASASTPTEAATKRRDEVREFAAKRTSKEAR